MEIKKVGDCFSGKDRESLSNVGFKAMTLVMKLMDILGHHSRKIFKTLARRLLIMAAGRPDTLNLPPALLVKMAKLSRWTYTPLPLRK